MKSFVSAAATAAFVIALWPSVRTPAMSLDQPAAPSDLDAFMAQVLERRNDAWRALHDYILSERESVELLGPGDIRLFGGLREYTWFVRDGYLIRSPVRFNGVAPSARERQDYETRWLEGEQSREKRAAEKQSKAASAAREASGVHESDGAPDGAEDSAALVGKGFEPRFISEAYFMQFKFDPGNYYLAGRETLEGRRVLRIEYYPKQLYRDEDSREKDTDAGEPRETKSVSVGIDGSVHAESKQESPADVERRRQREQSKKHEQSKKKAQSEKDIEKEFERKFNKVALITLWVDPAERQIVKYTFDNTEMNFLPGRWLVRVGDVSASMTMGQPIGQVWLPRAIEMRASLTLANGDYEGRYSREFLEYRQGEVRARIRSYSPREN